MLPFSSQFSLSKWASANAIGPPPAHKYLPGRITDEVGGEVIEGPGNGTADEGNHLVVLITSVTVADLAFCQRIRALIAPPAAWGQLRG